MNRKSSYLNIEFLSACTEAKLYPEHFGNEVAICGRSNSGKSSIINALANSKKLAKTSNTPGRTQSINFFSINSDVDYKLVDLPGYGYAKASKKNAKRLGAADYELHEFKRITTRHYFDHGYQTPLPES